MKNLKKEFKTLEERKNFISLKESGGSTAIECGKESLAGAVSQRACVYCGARVVLNPITDAYHLIHGPIGCSSYTWDIRGSLSSGAEVFRNSFSTDLSERDIIFGGEEKLSSAIKEIVERYQARVIFVYATCVVGVIGDDIEAVCKKAEEKYNIRVIPVQAAGFAGNKMDGYKAAGRALMELMDIGFEDDLNNNPSGYRDKTISSEIKKHGINIMGDFNLAGEMWIIKNYLREIGINVNAGITGDSTCEEISKASRAGLNFVQCAGSMVYLAKKMQKKYGMPYQKISFVGIEDTVRSLFTIASFVDDREVNIRLKNFVDRKRTELGEELQKYRKLLWGRKVAIYVGGGFKAISLIKQFKSLGMIPVMVGTQTGKAEEYEKIHQLVGEGTVVLDDANPTELENFMTEKEVDLLAGGVKERPLAYKLKVAFCDHNHERKHPLIGFEGALNFARELHQTVNSPVWRYVK
ncbi:MAG: nitrogenase iron-molybdenum cofactor biosynthesis protein NifE [Halanaerobiales bacterium]